MCDGRCAPKSSDGLAIYRPMVWKRIGSQPTGEARGLIAAAEANPDRAIELLEEATRRYFVSSYGDEAAYQFGLLLLDRGEFVGATQVLEKLLNEYKNPSMSKNDIQLRLAVAKAGLGERDNGPGRYRQYSPTRTSVYSVAA